MPLLSSQSSISFPMAYAHVIIKRTHSQKPRQTKCCQTQQTTFTDSKNISGIQSLKQNGTWRTRKVLPIKKILISNSSYLFIRSWPATKWQTKYAAPLTNILSMNSKAALSRTKQDTLSAQHTFPGVWHKAQATKGENNETKNRNHELVRRHFTEIDCFISKPIQYDGS